VLIDCDDSDKLRSLKPNQLVICTKQDLLRGWDYRSAHGISLMVHKQVDSKRALQ